MPKRLLRFSRDLARDPAGVSRRVAIKINLIRLRMVNRLSRRRVTGEGDVVVSLTSFGHRLDSAFYALESIARGHVRPRRLILWLDELEVLADPPRELRRLSARGLEILPCLNYGPHKKQFPYVASNPADPFPLATADDDVIYPKNWLADLLAAAAEHPDDINGLRGHSMAFVDGEVAPYRDWVPATDNRPSFRTICTGVSGVIYPVRLLAALRLEGDRFLELAPRADDIWVHSVAVRNGIRGRQVRSEREEFPAIPGTQRNTLYRENVIRGGNDAQIAASYSTAELERLRRDDPTDRGPVVGSDRESRGG